MNEQPQENKVIGIWARVKVCEVNLETQAVTFEEGVSPKYAVQALLQEIQMLQNKDNQDKLPKAEETKDM